MGTIAVDFDGTLIQQDEDGQYFPIEGAVEAMRALREEGHRVVIHTCRTGIAKDQNTLSREVRFIEETLDMFGIEYDDIYVGRKLIADVYVDDRGVSFDGDWQVGFADTVKKMALMEGEE